MNIGGYIAVSPRHLFPENMSVKISKLTEIFLSNKINPKNHNILLLSVIYLYLNLQYMQLHCLCIIHICI